MSIRRVTRESLQCFPRSIISSMMHPNATLNLRTLTNNVYTMSLLGPIRYSKRRAFCTISTCSTATSSSCRIQLDRIRRRPFSDSPNTTRAAPPPPPPPVPENAESSRGGSSSSNEKQKQKSAHAQWYADTVPAMIPVALLGSAVYFVRSSSTSGQVFLLRV